MFITLEETGVCVSIVSYVGDDWRCQRSFLQSLPVKAFKPSEGGNKKHNKMTGRFMAAQSSALLGGGGVSQLGGIWFGSFLPGLLVLLDVFNAVLQVSQPLRRIISVAWTERAHTR